MHLTGEKLLPDYFLDEAEGFQREWLQTKTKLESSQAGSDSPTATDSPSSSEGTPTAIFAQVSSLLNSDVVGQIKATYLFVVDGEHPGK